MPKTQKQSKNANLQQARNAKNDEFYTRWHDIETEIIRYLDYNPDVFRGKTILLPCDDPEWSNFTKFFASKFEGFGLKKLISTSYAHNSKKVNFPYQLSLFEQNSPQYDEDKTQTHGKIFILDEDINQSGKIDIDDLHWKYLEGDGDFDSAEVRKLRDEADIIITNPPFSLFRKFLAWIMEADKKFIILGNKNAITYKEVFPLIKDNKIWLGVTNGAKQYIRPDKTLNKMGNTGWFTNIEHGRRLERLECLSMDANLRYSRHADFRKNSYQKYDNYDAIEVPYTDVIPSDYDGVMGVPISFLDKYCPEQFEIIGLAASAGYNKNIVGIKFLGKNDARPLIKAKNTYARIFIKHKY